LTIVDKVSESFMFFWFKKTAWKRCDYALGFKAEVQGVVWIV